CPSRTPVFTPPGHVLALRAVMFRLFSKEANIMADYVTHDLRVVRGDPDALRQFLSQDSTGLFLDFNKLVSMPDDIRGVLNGSMAINGYAALFGDWTTLGYPGQFSSREQAI